MSRLLDAEARLDPQRAADLDKNDQELQSSEVKAAAMNYSDEILLSQYFVVPGVGE